MMEWEYLQPVRIRFGAGMVNCLCEEIVRMGGQRGALVTSPSFVRSGRADRLVAACQGRIVAVMSNVSPNPDVRECDAVSAELHKCGCDFVVALGGGSVIDCAKAAATLCLTGHPATAYLATGRPLPLAHLPLIAIPTTAGTGSEITSVAVLSDHERGVKAPMVSDGFYPSLAIVDPELTYTMPPRLTACCGFDVLCHTIEAYWSRRHQPVCDALAVHAARLVFRHLATAVEQPSDAAAREHMAEASVMAGLAFTLPKTNSSHACSYPLTNLLGIPHGEACALTIDHFVLHNAWHDDERVEELATLLGFGTPCDMAHAIDALKRRTGVRCDLRDLQLSEEQVEELVQASNHPNLANNPIEITTQDLRHLYRMLAGLQE